MNRRKTAKFVEMESVFEEEGEETFFDSLDTIDFRDDLSYK